MLLFHCPSVLNASVDRCSTLSRTTLATCSRTVPPSYNALRNNENIIALHRQRARESDQSLRKRRCVEVLHHVAYTFEGIRLLLHGVYNHDSQSLVDPHLSTSLRKSFWSKLPIHKPWNRKLTIQRDTSRKSQWPPPKTKTPSSSATQ